MTDVTPTAALSPLRIEIDAVLTKFQCYMMAAVCPASEKLSLADATDQLEAIIERERMQAVREAFDRHGPWTSRNTEVMDAMFPSA